MPLDVRGFGDMSSATDPLMTVNVTVCGVTYSTSDSWTLNGTGWLVNFAPVDACPATPTPTPTP
ncbi:hypothetical protein KGQ64_07895 [bacterium]|nr:hypothetical protein [bacterium]